jgi:hypothetical protein
VAITNGYATLSEVKAAARITDSVDDALLEMAVESSSRLIDSVCERRFYTAGTETHYYVPTNSYVVDVDDIPGTAITLETSSAADGVYDVTWQLSRDAQLEPLNRHSSGLTFPVTRIRAVGDYLFPMDSIGTTTVKVTSTFGFNAGTATIPMAIRQATIISSLRVYKRLDSPLGIAGFGDMGAVRVSRVDPDIAAMIAPFRKRPPGIA